MEAQDKLTPTSEEQEMLEARKKLQGKIGDARTGGKGSQRRKKKAVHKVQGNDDKKFKSTIKKYGIQPLQQIDEVMMFKDDNSVLHFTNPEVMASIQSNTFVIMGNPETKSIKDLLPGIITHLGPKQLPVLQEYMKQAKDLKEENKQETVAKDDDIPELKENFEEASKKEKETA